MHAGNIGVLNGRLVIHDYATDTREVPWDLDKLEDHTRRAEEGLQVQTWRHPNEIKQDVQEWLTTY
jgi:hypothetical protein